MNEHQLKLLQEILNKLAEAAYPAMGQEWVKELWEQIAQLKYAGKP